MNVATLVSVTTAVVGTLFAAMTWSISDAPGLRGLRWFSASSMCGAGYACAMAAQSSGSALAARIALRFVVLLMALHASSWLVYSSRRDERPLYRFEKAIVAGSLCFGMIGLFPGTLYASEPWDHPIPWLGIQYNDARSTTLGNVTFVYLLGAIGLVAVRAVLRFRRGDRNLAGEIVGLFALALAATSDSLVSSGVLEMPYLLDVGYLVLVVAVSYDLSRAYVRNARQLRSAEEELVRQARLAALGEMSAVVAHEVRNPVAVIFNAIATLRKRPEDPDKLLGIVEEEAERLKRMVADLLEFARPESLVLEPSDVQPIVESAIEAVRTACPESAVDVELELASGLPKVHCDERLVRQAVINLLTNAVDAPDRRGPVRVTATCAHRRLSLRVIDEGRGVPKEIYGQIFLPFFTTRATGTGLGLPVVRRIAEAHGGGVTLLETPGGGATFELSIPVQGPGAT